MPVIICARNEERDLPATLVSLSRSDRPVVPVVVNNGTDDETSHFAKRMGALVVDATEIGKVAALQLGLSFIAEELSPCGTVLTTDADTIVGASWSSAMTRQFHKQLPEGGITFGPVMIRDGESRLTDNLRSFILNAAQIPSFFNLRQVGARGANMAIATDDATISAIQSVPNVFPGADVATRDAVLQAGGHTKLTFRPSTCVVSRGDRFKDIFEYLQFIRKKIPLETIYPELTQPPAVLNMAAHE